MDPNSPEVLQCLVYASRVVFSISYRIERFSIGVGYIYIYVRESFIINISNSDSQPPTFIYD